MGEMRLSVVVCTRDRAPLLDACLGSLATQTLTGDAWEVVVVDNGSTDRTCEVAAGWAPRCPGLRLVTEPAAGLSRARNRGWREARGRFVAFLDDDARAEPDWASRVLAAFEGQDPPPAAVGGRILPEYETPPPPWFDDALETRTWGDVPGFLPPLAARSGFSGSNMAVRRDLLEACGGFSPAFGMVGARLRMGEDTELFHRLYPLDGRLWYDPRIVVRHRTPARCFRLGYRARRAFQAGRAIAAIEGGRRSSLGRLRSAAGAALAAAALPFRLAGGSGARRSRLVRLVQDLAFRAGCALAPAAPGGARPSGGEDG